MPTKKRQKKIVEKPMFDYKDTTVMLAIVCAALIVRALFIDGKIICEGTAQIIVGIVGFIAIFSIAICWVCEKLVNIGKEKSLPQTVKSISREETHTKCDSVPNIAQRKD